MTAQEIIDAVPTDVQAKADAQVDVRTTSLAFGDALKQTMSRATVHARGIVFDRVYASLVSLDMNDAGALERLKTYVVQLIRASLQLGMKTTDIEKAYLAFWR